jgi:uncharacterized protein (TIRG00374 family)
LQKIPTSRMRTVLVSALAVALFAWFLRDASLADVWVEVRRAGVGYLGLGFVAMTGGYFARVIRWQCLLAPIGHTRFSVAGRATAIGYAASFLLPARAGDVLRPLILARQEGLRATSVFATVVFERALDLVLVLTLLGTFIWSVADGLGESRAVMRTVQASGAIAAVGAVVLLAVLQVVAHHPERIGSFTLRVRHFLPERIARRFADSATAFSAGLAVARTPRMLAWALMWSVPVWVLSATQIWCVTLAFGIPMPFAGSFLEQALLVVGVSVPTPGGVGSFHEAYRIGATVFFGASEQAAVGAAIVLHALAFIPITLLGVVFMIRDGLSPGRLRRLVGRDEEIGEAI